MFEKIKIEENVPLSKYTSIKIGGPAKYLYNAKSSQDLQIALQEAKAAGINTLVIGAGSNLIFSDKGFDGLVIRNLIKYIKVEDDLMSVGAGNNLNEVVTAQTKYGLGDLEFLAGIPGNIGGAVWMNAGSRKIAIGNYVKEVEYLDEFFNKKTISGPDSEFGYRKSIFQDKKYYITGCVLNLDYAEPALVQKNIGDNILHKQETQDLKYPSAGCVFKNPMHELTAAQMIEECQLKGKKIGGLEVSSKHANYIINTGKGKAEDFVILTSLIKQQVRDTFNVQLEFEIQMIGF
ncbi:UDP-N-acetylmuramate dehydrogenase [Patescibacteria group bacterium]|nr:UDP-N-acetylmuramate dehydrogenase [Patescibacteria group bacterium]MBU1673719.1 UDP-N-acetylmuramate dehydrogenase [Patescibacteria group bacterium]MBU1963051.1 UDP-N-acetylmuramate dehydrogenase [Patescibacteria group bacterium]